MSYTKSYTAWQDYPDTSTPATAAKIQNIDDGVYTNSASIASLSSQQVTNTTNITATSATALAAIPKSTGSASGDIIYYSAASTPARLGIGSSGQVLAVSAGLPKWTTSAAAGSLAYTSKSASASVALTAANTYFDSAAVSLTAGTYLITSVLSASVPSSGDVTAKVWDGTTVQVSGEMHLGGNTAGTLSLTCVVALTGAATMKTSAASTVSSSAIVAAAPDNGAGNNASSIFAVQIA